MSKRKLAAVVIASTLALGACSASVEPPETPGDRDGQINVTTSFYPLTFLVEEIGGQNVTITDLTPPNADAHGIELSPREVADLEKSDLVLSIEMLSPAIDNAIAASNKDAVNIGSSVNLLTYEILGGDPHAQGQDVEHATDDHGDHGTHDPHFWTDPNRMMLAADQVATELTELDPDNSQVYEKNLVAVKERLQALVDEVDSINSSQCRTNAFLVTHKAFAYMAYEGDLLELGIAGFDPEIEPSPARVREVTQLATEHKLDTVFATSDGEVKTASAIGDEAGLTVEVLDPAATQRDTDLDYIQVMERNLELLKSSMGC